MQNAEAAKDPLSDLISYNLLLAHRHFLVSRIIIMITDSDVPRHDRFHSCHSCGYPPRRCLFSKHITSLNIGGGRDGGGGWGYPAIKRWGAKFLLNFVLLQYTLVKHKRQGAVNTLCLSVSTVTHSWTAWGVGVIASLRCPIAVI